MYNNRKEADSKKPEKVQGLYTLSSPTKWGLKDRFKRESAILKCAASDLKKGATILEIGSGRGEFAELVKTHGFRYLGIEPSASMRKSLVDRGYEILGDTVPPINLGDESVDLVYSNAVIEHFENYSTVLEYFKESWRVLKKSGIMCSVVPNCDTIGMLFYLRDYQHSFITNYGRLERLSRDTGFEVIASRCFLTNIGLSSFNFLDRIFAHVLMPFVRSPLIYSLIRLLCGDDFSYKIYKNLYDLTIVISRKL